MDLTPLFTSLDFHWPDFAISAFALGPLSGRRSTTAFFSSSKFSLNRWLP
jgi:hypothetical protein